MTGAHRAPEPSDERVVAALVGGEADPEVEAAVRAIYGQHVKLRPGGLVPRVGCSTVAHEKLGWCATCPGVALAAEVTAWRLLASGYDANDHQWARLFSKP